MTANDDRTVYRWSRARLVRPLGLLVVAVGALWIVVLSVLALAGGPGTAAYVVLSVITLAALVAGLVVLARPPAVLEVSSHGYRLHNLRGGGTAARRWQDVSSVTSGESVAGPVLVLEGRGQGPSVVPLALLGPHAERVQQQVSELLDAAHRYRRG